MPSSRASLWLLGESRPQGPRSLCGLSLPLLPTASRSERGAGRLRALPRGVALGYSWFGQRSLSSSGLRLTLRSRGQPPGYRRLPLTSNVRRPLRKRPFGKAASGNLCRLAAHPLQSHRAFESRFFVVAGRVAATGAALAVRAFTSFAPHRLALRAGRRPPSCPSPRRGARLQLVRAKVAVLERATPNPSVERTAAGVPASASHLKR